MCNIYMYYLKIRICDFIANEKTHHQRPMMEKLETIDHSNAINNKHDKQNP